MTRTAGMRVEPAREQASGGGEGLPYTPQPGRQDEMLGPDGRVREHWRLLLSGLQGLPPGERERRWREARQLIHDNGVSYNVYGDPQGLERPWSLEPMPVLLAADEWAALSTAVTQRARLLDALLADLYRPRGESRAVGQGWLPAELLFAHPGLLRPVVGTAPPQGWWLPLYAVDLARGPDGRWRALADRTQAPSGAGYALENRLVVSRALPEFFRENNVERLARFFRSMQQTLARLAPGGRDNDSPRVVLLTPGPYTATYFEQAYLAQYLGYTLSTGGDLTVRGDRVYLKTLGGLQPVDVLLRRVNDDYCDSLELRGESVLGLPGLLEAVRQGGVAVANPLGSGLGQSPVWLPYLPRLCRELLGEELRLPSVETWWCGDPQALGEVMSRFHELVLKPAFPEGYTNPVFLSRLSAAEREGWRGRVNAQPGAWVAQEELAASTAPSLEGEAMVPRALVLRSYAVATDDGHVVMPGALARVAGSADNPEVSMQVGAGSKDAWVLAAGPVSHFSLLPAPTAAVALSRGAGELPSQTADNLFWLGRYAERAEGIARLCRVLLHLSREAPADVGMGGGGGLQPAELLRALEDLADPGGSWTVALPVDGAGKGTVPPQVLEAIFDARRASSLASVTRQVVTVARLVRDRLSIDSWRVLAALGDELEAAGPATSTADAARLAPILDHTVLILSAFSGLTQESMTRGHAWRFQDIGRRLERGIFLCRLLKHTLVEPAARPPALLEAILEVADSGMTYRRRYLTTLQAAPVLDLLLHDETNPRSVAFQLGALVEHWAALSLQRLLPARPGEEASPAPLLAELQRQPAQQLARPDEARRRPALEKLLAHLALGLPALSQLLSAGYLKHAVVSRHLGWEGGGGEADIPASNR
jgi:uncharacterized circularly permuted ATP-grasp superfamily protein/uncharacterized alpha-E superfamily protein